MATRDLGPPGYGALIRLAREAQGISPETAAARMPFTFSGSSWRQIEAGYRGTGANRKQVSGKPSTVAAMARTVGVTADRLQEHHEEAAAILREMELQEAQQTRAAEDALRSAPAHVRRMIDAALEDVDPEDRAEVLRQMATDYDAVTKRRGTQSPPARRPRRTG
ncbi:helix-turn-helix domain-containing protein [Streptomyces cylindrosporus]|uniref:Helix-turn-helix domain-containing protein n=1 Tax=Streptomyces cylindrosporus TaxID=2927583 RepID=A0ABS9YJM8_9ACTN|nr:helix-turn-helix domain-containing protein [Streptomyces cylindrosporus]MCI3277457.1 helix-turn-helix domain-containing protein [Streptomyces cylindrosporus]